MGGYLGQTGTLEQRSRKFKEHELGIDPGTIVQGAATLFSAFGGGSDCSDAQKQERQRIEQEIRQYLTREDRIQLVQGMETDIEPTPAAMARFALGGKDCKHKNVTPGDQQFLNNLPRLIRQRKSATLPATMNFTSAGIPPAAKYSLYAVTAGGFAWLGYQGFKKLKEV